MQKKPLVSIVIPVFNGENFLDASIKSALNQTYDNIEVLVINDGSTDSTERIAKKYEDKIRYFYKENGGVSSALNFAIRNMKGEYFSWLSHDDYYHPSKIEYEIEAIQKQGDPEAIAYCNYDLLDQEKGIFSPYRIEDYYCEKDRANGILMLTQRMIGGCTLLIHISHFYRAGMFNEGLRTTQDYDMWFRIFRNIKLLHVPESLVVTRIHKKQGSFTIKEFDAEREQLFLKILKELSPMERVNIWGSEYTCLQNFYYFFEAYSMSEGCDYAKKQLYRYMEPTEIKQKQSKAKAEILQMTNRHISRIAILGAGDYGHRVLRLLQSRGIKVDIFLDNDSKKWGTQIDGIKCASVESELNSRNDILVVMAAEQFGQMQKQLEKLQFTNVITKMELEGKLYNVPPLKDKI